MRMISPKSVLATSMSPCLLNAIPFAPSGPKDGTAGCTSPHGPAAVVPFSNGLSDHIAKSPFLSRRQIVPSPRVRDVEIAAVVERQTVPQAGTARHLKGRATRRRHLPD